MAKTKKLKTTHKEIIPTVAKTMHKNAGTLGAVVGGVVGASVGLALSDKERRRMILKKMDDMKMYVTTSLDEIRSLSEDTKDMPKKTMRMKKLKSRQKNNGHHRQTPTHQHAH